MNNRIIKFRAWNTNTQTMIDLKKITPLALDPSLGDCDGLFLPFNNAYKLMQFTGLLDKQGKEIYDISDVIKHNEHKIIMIPTINKGLVGVVINRNFGNILEDRMLFRTHHNYEFNTMYNIRKHIEIIGNIFENSDFLKKN